MRNRTDVDVLITGDDGSQRIVKIYVVRPTNITIKNADRYRAKTWNQCILDGVLTKKELARFLKDRNIWDEKKENDEKEIINQLQKLEKDLYLGSGKKLKLSDGQRIAVAMRVLRIKLRDLISERLAFEENTAEALSDNAKFDYFVADCTFHENGEKVYKDVDDYNSKNSDEIAFAAANALAQMMYQLDSKFEESLPENKWLKHFNLVNQDGSLVNKDGHLVDLEGRRINENGNYINEDGHLIDIHGNLINEDGTYVIQADYEIDTEEVEKPAKKKKTQVSTEIKG
jgi:hypothetical protein